MSILKSNPIRLGVTEVPIPSTRALADLCYPSAKTIVENVGKMLQIDVSSVTLNLPDVVDTPNKDFNGPF